MGMPESEISGICAKPTNNIVAFGGRAFWCRPKVDGEMRKDFSVPPPSLTSSHCSEARTSRWSCSSFAV